MRQDAILAIVGFQIVAVVALLLGLASAWLQLKDRWEERRVRGAPLFILPLGAWTHPRHYLVRLSVINPTSVDRHVAECGFDVWAPQRSAWRRTIERAWHLLTRRPPALTRRGAVAAAAIGLDPLLLQLLAQFPDPLGMPFVVPASATLTGTLAFFRFPWDQQAFDIVDIKEPFFYLAGGSRAFSIRLSLVDDRGHSSDATVLIPWTPPPPTGQPAPEA